MARQVIQSDPALVAIVEAMQVGESRLMWKSSILDKLAHVAEWEFPERIYTIERCRNGKMRFMRTQ
jgi:hypothetical protein